MKLLELLLVVVGAIQVWGVAQRGAQALGYVPGVLAVAVAAGLWLRARWARWLGLGACFITIIGACVMPVVLFLFGRHDELGSAVEPRVLLCSFALFLGAIGLFSLGYLRSDEGRSEFSAAGAGEDEIPEESSVAVILSSLVWVLAIGVAYFGRVSAPRAPAPMPAAQNSAAGLRQLPDLIPLGLCFREFGASRQVEIAYANIGRSTNDSNFRLTTADGWGYLGRWLERDLAVPAPGGILTAPYEREADETRKRILVRLDEEHRVADADADNNVALFGIPRHANGALALPDCKSMRIPTMDRFERAARSGPPNLIPIGLCMRGKHQLSVHFTNLGGAKGGLFQISQGRLQSKLSLVDRVYLHVPHYREVRSFSLGPLSEILEQQWETTDYFVKVDSADAIKETNEEDNLLNERVTRLAGGAIDLPDCDTLDDSFLSQSPVQVDAS